MRKSRIIFVSVLFLGVVLYFGHWVLESRILASLSNDDIKWDYSSCWTGPRPYPARSFVAMIVIYGSPRANDRLFKMLDDEKTFVVAHVFLAFRRGEYERTTEYKDSGEVEEMIIKWEGLEIDFSDDGAIVIDPSRRAALKEMWAKRLSK